MPHGMCLDALLASVNICWLHGLSNCSFSNAYYVCYTNCIATNRCCCAIFPSTLFCHPDTVPESALTHLISLQIQESSHPRGTGCERHYTLSRHRVGFSPPVSHTYHQLPRGNFLKSVREMHST